MTKQHEEQQEKIILNKSKSSRNYLLPCQQNQNKDIIIQYECDQYFNQHNRKMENIQQISQQKDNTKPINIQKDILQNTGIGNINNKNNTSKLEKINSETKPEVTLKDYQESNSSNNSCQNINIEQKSSLNENNTINEDNIKNQAKNQNSNTRIDLADLLSSKRTGLFVDQDKLNQPVHSIMCEGRGHYEKNKETLKDTHKETQNLQIFLNIPEFQSQNFKIIDSQQQFSIKRDNLDQKQFNQKFSNIPPSFREIQKISGENKYEDMNILENYSQEIIHDNL